MISHPKVKHGFASLLVCNIFEKTNIYILWKFRLGCKRNMIFLVRSTGKFPDKIELLKRWSRFPVGNFPMELRVPFTGFAKVFTSSRPLSTVSSVRKYGSYSERITSELAMNHSNAKTCFSRGIGGLPNACCRGTLPMACTSQHRSSKVPRVILNWLSN